VPQSSLKNMKAYAQTLDRHGIDTIGTITRLSFDYNEAYPKLLFNFVNVLDDATYNQVLALNESDTVKAMLKAPDFVDTASTPPQQNPQGGPTLQPLTPQAGPVMQPAGQTPAGFVDTMFAQREAAQTQQQAPVMQQTAAPVMGTAQPQTTPAALIELPDGRLYDPNTKQFVEKPAATVQMDPNTIELPGGQWFSMTRKVYVQGPEVDSPEVAQTPPTRAAATSTKGKGKTKTEKQAGLQAAATTPAEQPQQTTAAPQQTTPPVNPGETSPAADGDAPAGAQVAAAPSDMESLLTMLVPGRPQ